MGTTVLFSAMDDTKLRFPQYLSELQTFLQGPDLSATAPEAICQLAERVETQSEFRDDFASMLAVVLFQEPALTHLELLGLVLGAVSGAINTEALAADAEIEEPVRKLFQFVMEVRRRLHGGAPAPLDENAPETSMVQAAGWMPEASGPGPGTLPFQPASAAPVLPSEPRSALGRALAMAADDEVLGSDLVHRGAKRQAGSASKPVTFSSGSQSDAAVLRVATFTHGRQTWLAGAAGVLLGLLLGLFWRTRPQTQVEPQVASQAVGTVQPPPLAAAHIHGPRRYIETLRHFGGSRVEPPAPAMHGSNSGERVTSPSHSIRAASGGQTAGASIAASASSAGPHAFIPGAHGSSSAIAEFRAPATPSSMAAEARAVHLQPIGDRAGPATSFSGRPKAGRVVLGSAGIMAANLISAPAPAYPTQASVAQVQGEVIIEAVVGRDGDVIDTRVVSGPPMLREAAMRAVQQWRYRPYEVDGKAAEIATTARVEFKLDGN